MEKFTINGDHIELIKLLKASGLCESGGAAKTAVEQGLVTVDGQVEYRKRLKIRKGRKIEFLNQEIFVDTHPGMHDDGSGPNAPGKPRGKPMKLKDQEFDRVVEKAISRIPPQIKDQMENIIISVRKRPSRDLLRRMDIPPEEILFGVFEGVPLSDRSHFDPPLYPDTIFIFQEPLEEICRSQAELEHEIEVTVVHEVAHYLGMEEKELEALGYA